MRDDIGRTYAAATVALPSLQLTALQAAVAAAVSSGSDRLEAACVVSDGEALARRRPRRARATSRSPTVLVATPDGALRARLTVTVGP